LNIGKGKKTEECWIRLSGGPRGKGAETGNRQGTGENLTEYKKDRIENAEKVS